MTEKNLQSWAVRYARDCGWRVVINTAGLSTRGEPDLLLVGPVRCEYDEPQPGRVVWVELKTQTGNLTRLQAQAINDLIDRGQEAYVCRDKSTFMAILNGEADCRPVAVRGAGRRQ